MPDVLSTYCECRSSNWADGRARLDAKAWGKRLIVDRGVEASRRRLTGVKVRTHQAARVGIVLRAQSSLPTTMVGLLWLSVLSLGIGSLGRNASLQVSLAPQSWELNVSVWDASRESRSSLGLRH